MAGNTDNNNECTNNNNSKTLYTIVKNKRHIGKTNNESAFLNGAPKDFFLHVDESANRTRLDSLTSNKVFNLHRSGSPTLPNFGSHLRNITGNNQFPKKKNSITEIVEGNVLVQHDILSEEEDLDPQSLDSNVDILKTKNEPVLNKNQNLISTDSQVFPANSKTLKVDTSILTDDSDTMSECNSVLHEELEHVFNNIYLEQSVEKLYKKYSKINKLEDSRIKNGSNLKYVVNGTPYETLNGSQTNVNPFSMTISKKSMNYKRNRYCDISPYNYNRVKLPLDESFEGEMNNDYINASYIKLDCLNEKENQYFIASQGPTKHTYKQFWQMCFEEGKKSGSDELVIVMVTPLVEKHREKCFPYWPSKETQKLFNQKDSLFIESLQQVGNGFTAFPRELEVSVINESYVDGHYYTALQLKDLTHGSIVKVHHLYYDKWEDFSSPNSSTQIISLIEHTNSIKSNKDNIPVLSHCSAGVGRTGTFLALFYLYNSLKKGLLQNCALQDPIEATVKQLRLCRMKMVQTFDQYQFIYKVIKSQMGL